MSKAEAKRVDWIVIQASKTCDDDGDWESLSPEDTPSWVTDEEVLGIMMEGKMVSADPDKQTRWYRAVKVDAPTQH